MKSLAHLFLLSLGVLLTIIGAVLSYQKILKPKPLIAPVLSYTLNTIKFTPSVTPDNKMVLAFLPFWLVDQVKDRPLPPLTHLAYFGLEFDGNGNLKTLSDDGFTEPGLSHYNRAPLAQIMRRVKAKGGKTLLVLQMMNNDDIESALSSSQARRKIITTTVKEVKERGFDGVNIDIEYAGFPPISTAENLTKFVKEFRQACPDCELSIDDYADSAVKPRLWQLATIEPHVDYVVIMGYDFYYRGSDSTGPVAPLRASCKTTTLADMIASISPEVPNPDHTTLPYCSQNYDVTSAIRDHLKFIPREKLVLAVPFYGYEWSTDSNKPGSPTLANGITATYDRILALVTSLRLVDEPHELKVDERTFTPYLTYQDGNQTKQIWFDDINSLKLKRQLVDSADIKGLAVWAWGYEDETGSLWSAIQN